MCYRPITIKNPATGERMQVPCGKCLDCLRKYQNDWSIRMYEEYKSKGCKGVFFTLTYDDAHVPKNYLVDGQIFRSSPDYGFGNVRPDKGYGAPKCERGVRRKYAEAPHACLSRAGVLRDDCYECNQDIIHFNEKRQPSKHRAFLSHLQRLFGDYFALSTPPSSFSTSRGLSEGEFEEVERNLTIESVVDDVVNSFKIDEETGELIPKSDYCAPVAELFNYRERPIVEFNSVRKEDVQLWLKRNRSRSVRENSNFKISYFITSEYGPTTLRPHYHGVIFGACASDLRDWFRDWQQHYGVIVDYSDLDITKGGLNYVSKYCSKGSFEHPLCAKDFFYFYRKANNLKDVICSEYHSKHYEKCVQWFGIDAPIVDPTFHLISKSLGVDWCEKDIPRCKEFEEMFVHYSVEPIVDFDKFIVGDISLDDVIKQRQDYEKRFEEFRLNGATLETWLHAFSERCCYKRNFITSEGEKVVTFSLPKYYRSKMFGVGLRSAYPGFVQSCSDTLYREKLQSLASDNILGENVEAVLSVEAEGRQELVDRFNRCVDKFKRFYSNSKL